MTHEQNETHDDQRDTAQQAIFEDGLTLEGIIAEAIWEHILLSRQRGDEDGPKIDPGLQRDFNGL